MSVEAQAVFIPDLQLKSWLVLNYDTDSDGEISHAEALSVTDLVIPTLGIQSLEGIDSFLNVSSLSCSHNAIATVPNLEALNQLVTVDLSFNQLNSFPALASSVSELDLSHNLLAQVDGLETLNPENVWINSNLIIAIPNLSSLSNLMLLDASDNLLTAFPTLPFLNLTTLKLNQNQLSDVPPLTQFVYLEWCDLSENLLTDLPEIPGSLLHLNLAFNLIDSTPDSLGLFIYLDELILHSNALTTLGELPDDLQVLDISDNLFQTMPPLPLRLRELNISHNQLEYILSWPASGLEVFDCSFNQLVYLEGPSSSSLSTFNASFNQLVYPPSLSNYSNLDYVDFSHNQLINGPNNTSLIWQLDVSFNQLDSLLPRARYLNCSHNYIQTITNFTNIRTIDCSHNYLIELPPSTYVLEVIHANNNFIATLDVGSATNLRQLDLSDNWLDVLPDLSNAPLRQLNLAGNYLESVSSLAFHPTLGTGPTHELDIRRNLLGPDDCPVISDLEQNRIWNSFLYNPQRDYDVSPWPQQDVLVFVAMVTSGGGTYICTP